MSIFRILFIISLIMMDFINGTNADAQPVELVRVEHVAGFPADEPGIEKGVSACFAGAVGDVLLMAGGCNFPEKPAAEGGPKRYYQGIYAAPITAADRLEWRCIGQLPAACAYGVSVPLDDGLLCIGGNNTKESFSTVSAIRLQDGKAVVTPFPSLPTAMDNFTGARSGHRVVVSNGQQVFELDLRRPERGWTTLSPLTAKKLGQPVGVFVDGAFCQWGGCTPKTDTELTTLHLTGQCLDRPAQALPAPRTAAGEEIYLGGAAAVSLSDDAFLALGGVNKDVFLEAVNHPQPDYMKHPVAWYRFNPYLCVWQQGAWHIVGEEQAAARAGAALVRHGRTVYVIGGELKPGVRTAEIYRFTFKP